MNNRVVWYKNNILLSQCWLSRIFSSFYTMKTDIRSKLVCKLFAILVFSTLSICLCIYIYIYKNLMVNIVYVRQRNTIRTMPRHAKYQIFDPILGQITPLGRQCSPKFRHTRRRRSTSWNFLAKHVPRMLYRIRVRRECRPLHAGYILGLKTFVYDVCMAKTCIIIHKHKFCTHITPQQTYMLFQNDVPIHLACLHIFGAQYNSPSNEQSCTVKTVSFDDVLLTVMGTWYSPYKSLMWISLQVKPEFARKTLYKPTVAASIMHVLYCRLTAGDGELPWAKHIWHACEHIHFYVPNVCKRFALKLSYPWLKTANETVLILCSICFFWQLLPNIGRHAAL